MGTVQPSLAGPKRPQDKVVLSQVDEVFNADLTNVYKKALPERVPVEGRNHDIGDGDVVIAAITSFTNTSIHSVLMAAGLVAKKAQEKGRKPQPGAKDSTAPVPQVGTDHLAKARLQAK